MVVGGYFQFIHNFYIIFKIELYSTIGDIMKCPECGKRMFKKNNMWECHSCGCNFVKNDNGNILTNLKNSDISNKINDYSRSNDKIGKIIDSVGNIGEQVSIQAKKEQAYIKSRNNNDSTELFDDNEFFISKVVLDSVDYVSGKKQEFQKEKVSESQNKSNTTVNTDDGTKQENNNTSTKSNKDNNKKQQNKGGGGLFNRKSPEQKEFDEKLKYYVGGTLHSDYYMAKMKEHKVGIFDNTNIYIKDILKAEFKNDKLAVEDMENRLDELMQLDTRPIKEYMLDKGYDTSLIKTEVDLHKFLAQEYGEDIVEKVKMKDKEYRKGALYKKYGIDTDEVYCFECNIEERRSSTFSNTDRRNVDTAYVALFDDYIAIIKESVWLKSDMGIRKVYFNNVTSIDYDTSGKLGLSSSLFLNMHSGEHVQLKFISKETVDEVQQRYEKFINEKNVSNTVQINQETSNADELLKYAELYKQGLLSEEEFEAKKKELL